MNHIGHPPGTAGRSTAPPATGSRLARAGLRAVRTATVLRRWQWSRWVVAATATLLVLAGLTAAGGLLSGARPAAFSGPGVPVPWWDYPLVAVTAVLAGLLIASYVRAPIGAEATLCDTRWPVLGLAGTALATGPSSGDNLLTQVFAGSSPALLAELIQPVLGIAAAALLARALATRLSRERSALTPSTDETGATDQGTCVSCRPLFNPRRGPSTADGEQTHQRTHTPDDLMRQKTGTG